jgi:inner membrane protein
MASGKIHAAGGGVIGLGIYGFYKWHKKEDWTFWGATGATFLGMVSALLPDIIEPAACNPNHRQIFHSTMALLSVFLAYNKIGRDEFEKFVVNIGLGGYASHLILDALTPRSLPIL